MAAKIKEQLDLAADIKIGRPGQYDVYLDDQLIASKAATGEMARLRGRDGFPDETLTLMALREVLATKGA